jgi:hypothetical protein
MGGKTYYRGVWGRAMGAGCAVYKMWVKQNRRVGRDLELDKGEGWDYARVRLCARFIAHACPPCLSHTYYR